MDSFSSLLISLYPYLCLVYFYRARVYRVHGVEFRLLLYFNHLLLFSWLLKQMIHSLNFLLNIYVCGPGPKIRWLTFFFLRFECPRISIYSRRIENTHILLGYTCGILYNNAYFYVRHRRRETTIRIHIAVRTFHRVVWAKWSDKSVADTRNPVNERMLLAENHEIQMTHATHTYRVTVNEMQSERWCGKLTGCVRMFPSPRDIGTWSHAFQFTVDVWRLARKERYGLMQHRTLTGVFSAVTLCNSFWCS